MSSSSTPYTPVWRKLTGLGAGTAPDIGNGTIVGRYRRDGKHVQVKVTMTKGTTTNFHDASGFAFSLPTFITTVRSDMEFLGNMLVIDSTWPSGLALGTGHWIGRTCCHAGSDPEIRAVFHTSNNAAEKDARPWNATTPEPGANYATGTLFIADIEVEIP